MKQQVNIKFCCKLGKTAAETHESLKLCMETKLYLIRLSSVG